MRFYTVLYNKIFFKKNLIIKKKVYVVVTEEWYGGGNKIKVFLSRIDAQIYIDEMDDGELDIQIYEKYLQD